MNSRSITLADRDNNVEIVRIEAPAPGRYLVQVSAYNLLSPQYFALVATGDLTSAIDSGTQLFLYIGEVGNNGEVAAGAISVSDVQAVPGPVVGAGLPGLIFAGGAFLTWRRKRKQLAA